MSPMSDSVRNLAQAGKQLLDVETMLGGDFLPRGGPQLPQAATPTQAPAPAVAAPPMPARMPAPAERMPAPAPATQARQVAPTRPPFLAPPPPPIDGSAAPLGAAMTPERKKQALEALDASHVKNCSSCALAQRRTQTVFGEGSPSAQLVFVGEGPGEDEDRSGRPFVGKAGQLLDKMIKAMGLERQDVFICNVVKCRPPGNRTPAPDEMHTCSPYLIRQLEILAPKVIVALGNPATHTLLKTTEGITRLRGNWQALPDHAPGLGGIPVMPTFHPSYVLRQYTEQVRKMVWGDLQKVMERLGLKRS